MKRAVIHSVLNLPFYTEGPVVDEQGLVFFTTLRGGYIGRWEPGGVVQWARATCPNGQVIDSAGSHLVCESLSGSISGYNPDGSFRGYVVQDRFAGEAAGVPNDLVLSRQGDLYFTDSTRETGRVFCLRASGAELRIAGGIDYANGLAFSPDESRLYVAESYKNRILALDLDQEGTFGAPVIFALLPVHPGGKMTGNLPDGLAVDREGRLWIAHYGMGAVQVLSPGGEWLFSVDTQLPLTSNVAFRADEPGRKVLVVTGGYGEPGPGAVLEIEVFL